MNVLTLMVGLVGAVMAFAVLAALTKKARDYLTFCQDEDRRLRALQEENPQSQDPPEDPASQPQRAAWWWGQLLSRRSMVGLVLLLVELPILMINSYLIAISLEVIFPNPPVPLGVVNIGGWWERTITVFDLYGMLISLAQMVSASVYHLTEDNKRSLIWWSSVVALFSLMAFEVGIAFRRGLLLEGEINAYLSALLALGIATTEVSAGILVIDYFLVSFLLTLFYTLTAPFWAMVERAKERKRRRLENQVLRSGSRVLRPLATPLAAIDQAIMEPLRSLDSAAADLWSRATTNSKQKGEDHGANENVAAEISKRVSESGNSSEPPGVRN